LFTFTQGDWEEAAPIMTSGCGLLLSPSVAARNQVGIGDTLAVSGSTSRVDCVVAGIGNFAFANISIISLAAGDDFNVGGAGGVYITPNSGADQDALRNDLEAVVDRYPGTTFNELSAAGKIVGVFDRTRVMTNALLLLTCLAAGLGVVSTTVASLEERRRELALMRAVGADDRQLTRLVVGEAGVIGLFGGVLGLAAGLGGTFIFILAAGASNWGLYDLPLWPAAVEAGSEALKAGVFGLLIGPGVSVLAAWIPARAFLRDDLLRWLQAD
jgi:putative ABC transport system permease protein